jgi:sporulation protein YlmC with PRC-barrel domain
MRTMTFAIFAMFLVSTAHAQQTPSGTSINPQVTTPIAGIDLAALAGGARASKLIGSKVYKGDTSIGQIEDVLVNLDRATIMAVILSVGGFLGMGDKLVAVPVNQIKVGSEAKFTTDLTKEQLASAPARESRSGNGITLSSAFNGVLQHYLPQADTAPTD